MQQNKQSTMERFPLRPEQRRYAVEAKIIGFESDD